MKIRILFGELLFAIAALCGAGLLVCMTLPFVLLFRTIFNGYYYEFGQLALGPVMGSVFYGIPNLACGFFSLRLLGEKAHRRRSLVIKIPWFIAGGVFALGVVGTGITCAFRWLLR